MKTTQSQPQPLQPQRLLRRREVEALASLNRTALYAAIKRGDFPAPKRLPGSNAVRWIAADVEQWISNLESSPSDAMTAAGEPA
ncbi:helix-turn-helix transcriptional regulator [Paraburkholderia diazotrophica]|uniref:Transcriptional regulator, AlpA family n=1 Tax=Paraburkholderia diazotrophica TaxID=667676 RepID=A0A1H7CBP0_9BURK|nr:AlpA family phage regulatory protein [Paraburkholderia diazotrophica]SEJ87263.1 transcriptional regulator, AlpA family [Paraburkholderia diazotrophica]